MKLLLTHEANFEAQDKYGNTSLHLACDSGNVETVQALLGAGKKVTLRTKNREGQAPLHIAVSLGEVEMVKALMAAGGRVDVKDKVGGNRVEGGCSGVDCILLLTIRQRLPSEGG